MTDFARWWFFWLYHDAMSDAFIGLGVMLFLIALWLLPFVWKTRARGFVLATAIVLSPLFVWASARAFVKASTTVSTNDEALRRSKEIKGATP